MFICYNYSINAYHFSALNKIHFLIFPNEIENIFEIVLPFLKIKNHHVLELPLSKISIESNIMYQMYDIDITKGGQPSVYLSFFKDKLTKNYDFDHPLTYLYIKRNIVFSILFFNM